MARPRSFDTETVLAAAQDLFWRRGYQASSLDELARVTGVNKPSLYAAFGDKAQLFLLVMQRYHSAVLAMSRQVLGAEGSARRALRTWLLGFLAYCSGEVGERGCLSVNTSLETSTLNPKVRASIDGFQQATCELLCDAFTRGKAESEFPPELDAASSARALMVAQAGLMAVSRGRPPAGDTLATMERLLDALVPPPASDDPSSLPGSRRPVRQRGSRT